MKCDATASFHVGAGGGGGEGSTHQSGLVHCTLDDDHDCNHRGLAVLAAAGGALLPVEWAQTPRKVRESMRALAAANRQRGIPPLGPPDKT